MSSDNFERWKHETELLNQRDLNAIRQNVTSAASYGVSKNTDKEEEDSSDVLYKGIENMEVAELTEADLEAINALGWED